MVASPLGGAAFEHSCHHARALPYAAGSSNAALFVWHRARHLLFLGDREAQMPDQNRLVYAPRTNRFDESLCAQRAATCGVFSPPGESSSIAIALSPEFN